MQGHFPFAFASFVSSSMPTQDDLRSLWLEGREGSLCGREQAKAWALREMWQADERPSYGMYAWIASRVKTLLNGKPDGPSPGRASIKEFFDKVDNDADWFPGKRAEVKVGPKRVLRGGKVTTLAMAMAHGRCS